MPEVPFRFPGIAELLRREQKWLSKRKSQHFLQNHAVCERIAQVCEAGETHTVLEIGAGLGNLSVELARRAGKVIAVEMDEDFRPWHRELTSRFPNLTFLYRDFLKLDLPQELKQHSGGPLLAVGNLPYQITSPILFKLIDADVPWESITVMVQREVAERMAAGVPSRQASALTYKLALLYDTEIALQLSPREFLPPPKVHSAVVVLRPLADPLVQTAEQKQRVFDLLTGVFSYRRKNLANGLVQAGLANDRPHAETILKAAGIDPSRRPETLQIREVLALDNSRRSAQA